jgi:hypothetical protein
MRSQVILVVVTLALLGVLAALPLGEGDKSIRILLPFS